MNSEKNEQIGDQREIPYELKLIVEKLQPFQSDNFLRSFENPRLKQVAYEDMSSLGCISKELDDNRPEWALNTWREGFKSLGLLALMTADTFEAVDFGFLIGLVSSCGPTSLKASPDAQKLNIIL